MTQRLRLDLPVKPGARFAALALAALGTIPSTVLACPVCQDPRDSNQGAFLSMTIFMSLLPLSLMAGVVIYVWRKTREPSDESGVATDVDRSRG